MEQLGFIYPGQKLIAALKISNLLDKQLLTLDIYAMHSPTTACSVPSLHETKQFVGENCTKVNLTILQANKNYDWYELIFQGPLTVKDAYYIRFYSCPAGFVKVYGRCGCDPILRSDTFTLVTLTIRPHYDLLTVGYLLQLQTILIHI